MTASSVWPDPLSNIGTFDFRDVGAASVREIESALIANKPLPMTFGSLKVRTRVMQLDTHRGRGDGVFDITVKVRFLPETP